MKNKNSIKEKHAVAGVIEALLLVALVAIVLSTIQLIYIPQVMEQREADHMDDVSNQFSFLKAVIDLQSMTEEDVPISAPITLGSIELPYFVTARARGQLDIIDDAGEIEADFAPIAPLTSIKYEAYNSYFVDQTYVLEGGGIIVKQHDGETMRVEPAITVENLTTEVNIYYDIPIITSVPGKNSTGGHKNCFIRTNYSDSDANPISLPEVNSTRIYTEYIDAWYDFLNESLGNNAIINKGLDYVEIKEKVKSINLYYTRIYIYAQISPGWVK